MTQIDNYMMLHFVNKCILNLRPSMPEYLSLSSTQLFNWHDKNRLYSFLTYIHYLSIFVKEIGENKYLGSKYIPTSTNTYISM